MPVKSRLPVKIGACFIVFALMVAWSWRADTAIREDRYPQEIHDLYVRFVHPDDYGAVFVFGPREYVKILTKKPTVHYDTAGLRFQCDGGMTGTIWISHPLQTCHDG